MPERDCPQCGTEGYENRMFGFYKFKCEKCGFKDDNLKTVPPGWTKDMTLSEYVGVEDE